MNIIAHTNFSVSKQFFARFMVRVQGCKPICSDHDKVIQCRWHQSSSLIASTGADKTACICPAWPAGVDRKIKPQELFHQVNVIGADKKPANYLHLHYIPQAVGELCSFVYIWRDMLVSRYMFVFTLCIYTNTVSTSTVPDIPSSATPTVQNVKCQ